jgi:hypothetical protein
METVGISSLSWISTSTLLPPTDALTLVGAALSSTVKVWSSS